jgi:hypothetical protein
MFTSEKVNNHFAIFKPSETHLEANENGFVAKSKDFNVEKVKVINLSHPQYIFLQSVL